MCNLFAGTAAVAVAGLTTAMKMCNSRLSDQKFLFVGAGQVT